MSGRMAAGLSSSGGADADCTELYKESRKLLSAAVRTSARCESALLDLCATRARQEALLAGPTNVGRLRALHNAAAILEDARATFAKAKELEDRFIELARDERSCRRTIFFRARTLLASLERIKLSIAFLLQRFSTTLLQLVSSRGSQSSSGADWLFALETADHFNALLSDFELASETATDEDANITLRTLLHGRRNRGAHLHENFSPSSSLLAVKPITSSKILQILASQRCSLASTEMARSIVTGIDRRQMEIASEEVSWLTMPDDVPGRDIGGAHAAQAPIVLQVGGKNKDGNGNKRKNRSPSVTVLPESATSPTSDYHSQNGGLGNAVVVTPGMAVTTGGVANHFTLIEDFVAAEDSYLNGVFDLMAQVPGLLGKNVVKSSSKSKATLSRSGRIRMSEYYHDILWHTVGPSLEKLLLWGGELPGGLLFLPYGLQHPRASLGLSVLLQDHLYAKFGDGYPPVVFPCVQVLLEALNLHVVAAAWDLQFQHCLAECNRPRTTPVKVAPGVMRSGTLVTRAGKLFYDALKCIIRLNNLCHPDMLRDFVEHGSHDPEEYPFAEEAHALRRLLTTLHALKNWAAARAHNAVNAWQVRDFLLITQADLVNVEDCFSILQLESHERNTLTKSINIQLFTHVQAAVVKEIQMCQTFIKSMPENGQVEMAKVCRTFSLATLQNVFPSDRHWRVSSSAAAAGGGTGAAPGQPSPYVFEFIGRVLVPVFEASTEMKTETQQAMGRIAIKACCEAWLEHIKSSRIKFSDAGAEQISLDFGGLRSWIGASESVRPETRRYLLLLDSIRQCEGVAKLLRAKQGEVVDIKPVKNKVSPMSDDVKERDRPDSPVNQILDSIPAELYVANQQQWLSLKANSRMLSLPFCCR